MMPEFKSGMNIPEQKDKCPECRGDGLKWVGSHPYEFTNGYCPTCKGTGQKKLDNEDALEARTAFSRHCFGQEKLDSPELREKLQSIMYDPPCSNLSERCPTYDVQGHFCYGDDTGDCRLYDQIITLLPACDCCERPLEVDAQKQKIVDAVKEGKKQGRREVIKEIEEQAGETLFLLEDLKFWHDLREEKQ